MKRLKKPYLFGASIVAVALLAGGAGAYLLASLQPVEQPTSQTEVVQQESAEAVSYTGESGKTALESLQAVADVQTVESEFGPYVDTIGGVKSGTDGKYWIFYVDGQMAQVGAGEYVTKGGELIEWKFE